MSSRRSRFSRLHLLALCTFLVPLAALAVLGQNELQRQGNRVQAAMSREAQLFLDSAAQAFEQQFDLVPSLLQRSQRLIADHGTTGATLRLRELEGQTALLDIVIVDEQCALVEPRPPASDLGLPFASESRGRPNAFTRGLGATDVLLTHGYHRETAQLLEHLLAMMERADERTRGTEAILRFRLATVQHKLGADAEARENYVWVRDAVFVEGRPPSSWYDDYGAMAETALAEMGTPDDRLALLDRIATHRQYSLLPDGLRSALVERLVEGVPEGHAQHAKLVGMLREEHQRAQTRAFAGDYEAMLYQEVRRRLRTIQLAGREPDYLEVVATLGDATTLLVLRRATARERERFPRAEFVGLHLDLDLLMAPALEPFVATDGLFVLAVDDPREPLAPDDPPNPLVAAPEKVPEDFVAPSKRVHGMLMTAWPSDPARLVADADAQARNRVVLLLMLFGAAMAGALWLWRSVSREAELARLKVDLVSRVSHELKTPLALIRMYGETLGLGRARDREQAQHFGGIIARESERLTTMIQRILDFSRQQAGTLTYATKDLDLGELLRRVCDAYTPHLEARGAVLVDSVRGEAWVRCDETACESAVINLLENAAKYAIEGDDDYEIELDLVMTATHAVVEVRDRGRGIPAEECEAVFAPFLRASNAGEVRGAGIGLSLVRHFARAHGGEVSARPRDGGGAVFRLTLPLTTKAPAGGDDDRTP